MSTPNGSLRHRGPKDKQKLNGAAAKTDETLDKVLKSTKQAVVQEWDYKLSLAIITVLSFITRFFGINHPDEVVFDEVHFGKVSSLTVFRCERADLPIVRILLPSTNLFLRCTPSLREAPLRFRWLACWLRWGFQIREHWRQLPKEQRPLPSLPGIARASGLSDSPSGVPDHVGVRLFPTCLRSGCWPHSL